MTAASLQALADALAVLCGALLVPFLLILAVVLWLTPDDDDEQA